VFTISPSGGRERPGPRVGFTPFTISWSPDGSALAVGGNRVAIVRGSRVTRLRGSDCCLGYDAQVLAWSPDGSRVAFLGTTEPGFPDGGVAAVDGCVFTLIKHGGSPVWSPDGKRLAFVYSKLFMSDRNGHHIVAVPTTAIGSLLAWTR
jgi:Tol biopolymer transport system component